MGAIPPFIFILISASIFFAFPGVLLIRFLSWMNLLSKIITTIFISIGFWVVISWFISCCSLPLNVTAFSLAGFFILGYIAILIKKGKHDYALNKVPIKKIAPEYIVLTIALILLSFPLLFISIPPGCDTAMHGYITKLIINNNGLPHSYRPILPVDYFGSYSAGYHILTALVAGVNDIFLRHAINFISIVVYPLSLLATVFFLLQFFSEKTAIYTSVIYWGLNNSFQGTIGWGGNPTMLSFGFCLFSGGLILYSLQHKNRFAFLLSAIPIAAILLIHAIPAVIFIYIAIPSVCFILYKYNKILKWILPNSMILIIYILFLLAPFLIHFKNDNSPELILKIKDWQNEMMGKKLTNNIAGNLLVTIEQVENMIGYVPVILSGIAFAFLIFVKKYSILLKMTIYNLYIVILVFNFAYWFLPVSELLYPERVAFFMIICVSFYFGYALRELEKPIYTLKIKKKNASIYTVPVGIFVLISLVKIYNSSNGLRTSNINCNALTMAAFEWIEKNTEKDALLVAEYGDSGMWIPAFTNRATLGTHLHFIHEIIHLRDTMEAYKGPRYIFVTKRDIQTKNDILSRVTNIVTVFSNNEITIYH